jgi:hypothetical protein
MNAPRLPADHADRVLELEEQLESAVNSLMDNAVTAGWSVDEAQAAVRNIAGVFAERHSGADS